MDCKTASPNAQAACKHLQAACALALGCLQYSDATNTHLPTSPTVIAMKPILSFGLKLATLLKRALLALCLLLMTLWLGLALWVQQPLAWPWPCWRFYAVCCFNCQQFKYLPATSGL